jgi:hypothetical protein
VQFEQHVGKFLFVAIGRKQKSKEAFEDWFEAGSDDLWRGIP